ncbi:rhodanese-like domain-containing protein [Mangrovimonas cancribranchiae]|uniref:Rhodanese-like domain-containing protein n=1 Tax=Mangrovimonas cancribranchiae TaxID=3080055 RepID=A0AAU6P4R1_9FLAO
MKKSAFVLVLLSIVAMSCINRSENVKVVSSEEMQTLLDMDDVQLVDVRTPEEYNEGYIDHAQNIDYYSDTFEEDILELDKTKPVIVYCKSGGRSAKCAEKLIKAGFVKVYDLDGGISQWKHEGHQVTVK